MKYKLAVTATDRAFPPYMIELDTDKGDSFETTGSYFEVIAHKDGTRDLNMFPLVNVRQVIIRNAIPDAPA